MTRQSISQAGFMFSEFIKQGAVNMFSRRGFLRIGGLSISTVGIVNNLFSQNPGKQQSKLENMVAGIKPPTSEDYEARQENARRLMSTHKIDALFLIGSPDMQYFTGMSTWVSERTTG